VSTRDLEGGAGAKLRVLVPLAAGSSHTLRIAYALGLPAFPVCAENSGSSAG
jgi:hypothetical protein